MDDGDYNAVILPAQYYARTREETPWQRLALALLQNGIRGADGIFTESMKRVTKMRETVKAQRWLRDDAGGVFSVIWCCDMLDIDPSALRAGLARLAGPVPRLQSRNNGGQQRARPSVRGRRVRL